MIDIKFLGKMKKDLKKKHQELMSQVSPEERGKLQAQLNSMIDQAKSGPYAGKEMNDFMKEIYGR